jgi:hypothetical protein
MRDHLLDLVEHTYDLGCIDLVKITGDDKSTVIAGLAEDKSLIVNGEFAGPVADFIGTFGMPNLNKLKILLNLEPYREKAKLAITRKDTGALDQLTFENADGDFKNSYRFMATEIINGKLKDVKMKPVTWNVEFVPTVASIQRLKMQASANAEETNFKARTDGTDLKFYFGDHSTHAGNFVFQANVGGQLKREWSWPVKVVISILDLTGDKTMRISDEGVAEITVNSGVGVYTYKIPAQSK